MVKYSLYNVVWYDGEDAYVTKYILVSDTKVALKDVMNFFENTDSEVLKIDKLYTLDFDNVIAMCQSDENIKIHFEDMYF